MLNSPDPSGISHSVIVAMSASMDVRRLTRASSLPPAKSLQAFHVRSFSVSRDLPVLGPRRPEGVADVVSPRGPVGVAVVVGPRRPVGVADVDVVSPRRPEGVAGVSPRRPVGVAFEV
jgi:hypothetical protein